MDIKRSKALFEEAKRHIPGGVNSPVRAFRGVGGQPLFIAAGQGSRLTDEDGNTFIDYVLSWGPLILGHAYPRVVSALKVALEHGTSYGAPTALETELAQLVKEAVPSIEMVRFVNSGTEATMTALRLARAYTGRDKIIKFEGCYHGHPDMLLVQAGSGVSTLGLPDSPGVPSGTIADTLVAPFNNLDAVRQIFAANKGQIAAVIIEPVAGNMGVVPPQPGFLEGLRQLTEEEDSVLIFDEVMTGFRVAYGGAQEFYGITPDLTCLGKVIGGGLPVGAYGGRREIMERVAPLGDMYQAGTLSGNPLAMTAGIETLKVIRDKRTFAEIDRKAAAVADGITEAAAKAGVPVFGTRVGTMFALFFTDQEVVDYASAKTSDTERFGRYFHGMLEQGVYLAPSQFEAGFMSLVHSDDDIEHTIQSASRTLKTL